MENPTSASSVRPRLASFQPYFVAFKQSGTYEALELYVIQALFLVTMTAAVWWELTPLRALPYAVSFLLGALPFLVTCAGHFMNASWSSPTVSRAMMAFVCTACMLVYISMAGLCHLVDHGVSLMALQSSLW